MPASAEIFPIPLHAVCLTLQADAAICPMPVPCTCQPYQELHDVPDVETDYQQLLLLLRVNLLMRIVVWHHQPTDEEERPHSHGLVPFGGIMLVRMMSMVICTIQLRCD